MAGVIEKKQICAHGWIIHALIFVIEPPPIKMSGHVPANQHDSLANRRNLVLLTQV